MAGYIGNIPVPQALRNYDVFTATSGQTVFNVKSYDPSFIDVYQNGVKLIDGDDYTATDGNTVVLASGAALNDIVEVISFTTFYPADVVSASAGGTFFGAVSFDSDVTVSGDLSVADKIVHTGDTNTSIRFPAADTDSDDVIKAFGGGSAQFDLAGVRGATKFFGATSVTSVNPSYQVIDSLNFRARSKTALIHATTTFYDASDGSFAYAYLSCNGSNSQTQIGSVGTITANGADNIHPVLMLTNLTPGTNYLIQLHVSKSSSLALTCYGTIAVFT